MSSRRYDLIQGHLWWWTHCQSIVMFALAVSEHVSAALYHSIRLSLKGHDEHRCIAMSRLQCQGSQPDAGREEVGTEAQGQ